ncbi:unnamed protein product [Pocillopora meandrina]|uniref:Uncharacterized protein n=1 Tax=Pocillopora meandrina TaxID=46732 RepID=A0AAU9XEF5_9CNID|nr:unnamed protein product [Pocillopora meandrina]
MVPQPREASEALLDSDEGVKRAKITVGAAVVQKNFWCFLSNIELKLSPTPLSVPEVTEAEKRIVKVVQRHSFPIDIDKSVITDRLA